MVEPSKKMWASITAIISLIFGGGGYAAFEGVVYLADQRYVTIAAQNLEKKWELEDSIRKIDRKIKKGTADQDDMVDRAVFEERLKQLKK